MIELKVSENLEIPRAFEEAWERVFQQKEARFFDVPSRAELWTLSQARAGEIQKAFQRTCVVGIGGSSLGARALEHAFGGRSEHRLFFAESPDATAVSRWMDHLAEPEKVHFIFTSKSGKTLETLTLLDLLTTILEKSGLDLADQSTVICGAGTSPLRTWAQERQVPILPVPEDVGGRFSVLTPVGLVPAALLGVSLDELRSGARWALSQRSLVLQLSAQALHSFREEKWITQMWVYSDALQVLGLWWQQLWSESLGKKLDRAGRPAPRASTPMVCCGPQDQHSLLQQVQEGTRDKWIICLRDPDAERPGPEFGGHVLHDLDKSLERSQLGRILAAEADGFLGALKEAGISNVVLKASSSQPESWGAFFMLWELVIATTGEMMNIDAFNQPGVELGKRLALQSLRQRL